MSAKTYIASIVSLLAGVGFSPWIDDALKVIMLVVFVVITLTITAVFQIPKVWNAIVEKVAMDVLHRVLMHQDIQKLVMWKHEKSKEETQKVEAKEN
jgi:hypothetical protein